MNQDKPAEEWECQRCTFRNHPIDKKCEHCQAPRSIEYPNIPDVPVPEVISPFPKKEFINVGTATSQAHTPKRREVPQTSETATQEMNPEVADEEENSNSFKWTSDPNVVQGLNDDNQEMNQNFLEPLSMEMNSDPSNGSASPVDIYGQYDEDASPFDHGQDPGGGTGSPSNDPESHDSSKDDFLLPPLPNIQKITTSVPITLSSTTTITHAYMLFPPGIPHLTSTAPVYSSNQTSQTTLTSSYARPKITHVEDFLEMSKIGFQRSDFAASGLSPQILNNNPIDLATGNRIKPVSSTVISQTDKQNLIQNLTKPVVSSSNQSEQENIVDLTGDIDSDPDDWGLPPLPDVGLYKNRNKPDTQIPMDLTNENGLESAETALNLLKPSKISPNLLENPNPMELSGNDEMEPSENNSEWSLTPLEPILPPVLNRNPQFGVLAPSFSNTHSAIISPPDLLPLVGNDRGQPPGLGILPSALTGAGDRNIVVSKPLDIADNPPLKKIKPTKFNNKPLDLGARSSPRKRHQYSSLDTLSMEGFPNHQLPGHATEIASLRSATILPPSELRDFDPYAPEVPLTFRDDHFTDETTVPAVTEATRDATTTQGSTASSTTTTSVTTTTTASGARRKIPRSQTHTTTVNTQTTIYAGPSQRGPAEPMLVDRKPTSGTWACPICTYENRLSAQYCDICHDGRPPWYSGETPVPMEPEPPAAQIPIEQMAMTSIQITAIANSKAFVDEWVCHQCTVANQPNHVICQSCGKERPRGFVPTYNMGPATEETNASSATPVASITNPKETQESLPGPSHRSQSMHFSERLPSLPVLSIGSIASTSKVDSVTMEQNRRNEEAQSLTIYKNIEEYCRQADDKFVDDQFLPGHRSLVYPNGSMDPAIRNAVWLRPNQINCGDDRYNTSRWTVFSVEGPDSTDIQQGILGNCWFLSGLSVLVERPELLRKIFVTSEYNKYGVYMIRLCKDGIWQTVIIDDLLPCTTDGLLLYTQAKRKQLWVPLIEKALAKVHGCYEALQAGRSIEGLATLTGAPCESLQLCKGPDLVEPDPDMIWVSLLSSKEAKFLMGASCGGANMDVDESIYEQVNLRVRHAYSVLDVRVERLDNNADIVKFLQLRNPWAQQSWSGPWADVDYSWSKNPRLRARLQPERSAHGIFWIAFDDMLKYFDSVDICKTSDRELAEIRSEGEFPDSALTPPSSFFMQVYDACEIDFSIFQQGSRSQEASGRHPVDLCICVFRTTEQASSLPPGSDVPLGNLVACSRRQVKRHGSCFHFFEPGHYHIVALAYNHWMSAFGGAGGAGAAAMEYPKYVLALHSSRVISLSNFRPSMLMYADATIELVMKKGEKKNVRECATCYYLTRGWGGLIVVAENRHPLRHLQVECDCLDSRNVVSTRGSLKTMDSVPPLHKQVLIVLTQLDGHSGFTITHKLVHRMGFPGLAEWSNVNGNNDPALTEDVYALHKPRPL